MINSTEKTTRGWISLNWPPPTPSLLLADKTLSARHLCKCYFMPVAAMYVYALCTGNALFFFVFSSSFFFSCSHPFLLAVCRHGLSPPFPPSPSTKRARKTIFSTSRRQIWHARPVHWMGNLRRYGSSGSSGGSIVSRF